MRSRELELKQRENTDNIKQWLLIKRQSSKQGQALLSPHCFWHAHTHTHTMADREMGDSISLSWHKDQCSMAQGGQLSALTVGSDTSWHRCLRNRKTLSLMFTHERHRTPQSYLNEHGFNDLPFCVHPCAIMRTQGLRVSVYAWAHKCVWHCSSDSLVNASKAQCVSMCKCQSW